MARRSAWRWRALGAIALFRVTAGCNYDFDEFEGLGAPVDGGASGRGGAAGTRGSDAAVDGGGKSGAPNADASSADGRDVASSDATSEGRGGAAGSPGTGGASGTGGSGGSGTSGSGGSDGKGGAGGSGGSAIDAGSGGNAGASGNAGTGGASGTGAGGAGSGGASGGGAAGSGGTSTGAGGGNMGGGAGSGGKGGAPSDGGASDVRADTSRDSSAPPFDCASVSGRVFEARCYYARTTAVTWDVGASQACPPPAHLVTITSAEEHTFVSSFLSGESRWIGLRRPANAPKNPSAYAWVTGEANTLNRWYSSNGEPDYDGECVRLGSPNMWGDHPCSAQLPVICERE